MEEGRPPPLRKNCQTRMRLFSLSVFSMISESSMQFALLVELALLTSSIPAKAVAAYAAVASTTTFAIAIFNFLLITTMAQVGKAVGRMAWDEIGQRFRVAVATALIIGCICAGLLVLLEEVLLTRMFKLEMDVLIYARSIYRTRLLLIPLMMVQRVCRGLLGGYGRVKALAIGAVAVALMEIVSQVVSLRLFDYGLVGATWGAVTTAMFGVLLLFFMAVRYPPDEAVGHVRILSCCASIDIVSDSVAADTEQVNRRRVCCDFASASVNTTMRSLLLTASVYSMSVASANLGTSSLTAHQIALALWMLMSLVADGFADVATMLGSRLMGEKNGSEMRVLRDILMMFGCVLGLLATLAMWFFRDSIINLYDVHNDTQTTTDVSAKLMTLWPLLCGMQIINSSVFVLDGFVYATQSFSFIRNLMIIGVVGWFAPAMLVSTFTDFVPHTLLAVWISKAGLNLIRAVGALWLMYVSFPRVWSKEEAMLKDPLLLQG